jgi:hypothetical protein
MLSALTSFSPRASVHEPSLPRRTQRAPSFRFSLLPRLPVRFEWSWRCRSSSSSSLPASREGCVRKPTCITWLRLPVGCGEDLGDEEADVSE